MKKLNFFKSFLVSVLSLSTLSVSAQNMDNFETNWYADYVGARIAITAPQNIAGALAYDIANDGSGGTNEWGAAVTTAMNNIDIVKAVPYEACVPLTNGTAVNGKIALIKRGNCEFGAKALRAQQAGAVAVVIVNNVPGGPVGMGIGAQGGSVTIPVIMISDVDGAAIDAALANGAVTMSLSSWASGAKNDIAILDGGVSQWHAQSIPLSQIQTGAGTPGTYEGITGAVIGNFGTNPATNIKVKSTVTFTPTGGSASVVNVDSVTYAGPFNPGDSIISPMSKTSYSLGNVSGTGTFNVSYEVTSDSTDDLPGDNKTSYSFDVTSNNFSKGRYNFQTGLPTSNIGFAFATSVDFMWGPLYYINKGNYSLDQVQFGLSKTGGGDMSTQGTVNVLVWKWVDGSNSQAQDGIIVSGECTLVGAGGKTYGTGDTSGQFFRVDIGDANNANNPVILDDNSWYWVTVSVPINTFLLCDGVVNYFPRTYARAYKSSDTAVEAFSPVYNGTDATFTSSATEFPNMFPFDRFNLPVDSVRFSQQKSGSVPSVPLFLSPFTVDVKNVNNTNPIGVEMYPNPATDVINISVELVQQASNLHYSVIDASGRRIIEDNETNVKSSKYTINTEKLPAGNYFLTINADDKVTVKKFSVVK